MTKLVPGPNLSVLGLNCDEFPGNAWLHAQVRAYARGVGSHMDDGVASSGGLCFAEGIVEAIVGVTIHEDGKGVDAIHAVRN